jgi:hypothetical protein
MVDTRAGTSTSGVDFLGNGLELEGPAARVYGSTRIQVRSTNALGIKRFLSLLSQRQ